MRGAEWQRGPTSEVQGATFIQRALRSHRLGRSIARCYPLQKVREGQEIPPSMPRPVFESFHQPPHALRVELEGKTQAHGSSPMAHGDSREL